MWKVEDTEQFDQCSGVLQPQRHEAEDFVNEVPVKEGAYEVDLHVAGAFLHEPLPKQPVRAQRTPRAPEIHTTELLEYLKKEFRRAPLTKKQASLWLPNAPLPAGLQTLQSAEKHIKNALLKPRDDHQIFLEGSHKPQLKEWVVQLVEAPLADQS